MSDIIIHKPDNVSDREAIERVYNVIRDGRISDNGKCYCYVTRFMDGFTVLAHKRKADIFTIRKESSND